jgi:broad specificity phosphatase PhoE
MATLGAFIQVLGPKEARQALFNVSSALKPGGDMAIFSSPLTRAQQTAAIIGQAPPDLATQLSELLNTDLLTHFCRSVLVAR